MKDYSKTIIYKIVGSGMTYYGHTTQTIPKRKSQHKDEGRLCTSKFIIYAGEWDMIWIEDYPCKNKKEAHARERWWIENNPCVNKCIPGRTHKEWAQDNKEHLKEYHKKWSDNNRDKIHANNKKSKLKNRTKVLADAKVYREKNKERDVLYRKSRSEFKNAYDRNYREWKRLNTILLD